MKDKLLITVATMGSMRRKASLLFKALAIPFTDENTVVADDTVLSTRMNPSVFFGPQVL